MSPYKVEIMGYIFRFSTQAHADKFEREAWKRKEWLDDSLTRRFHVPIDTGVLAFIQLYQMIEGRGFYMQDGDNVYTSSTDIQLVVAM